MKVILDSAEHISRTEEHIYKGIIIRYDPYPGDRTRHDKIPGTATKLIKWEASSSKSEFELEIFKHWIPNRNRENPQSPWHRKLRFKRQRWSADGTYFQRVFVYSEWVPRETDLIISTSCHLIGIASRTGFIGALHPA
ncbi:hypothetical protein MTO96_021101 [Rhipicephalus appendiculatus]